MSFGEPIALRGHSDLEDVASAARDGARSVYEEQFIERLRSRDSGAFDYLVKERTADVFSLLYRLTEDREEAQDLTQEVFLRAFQNIDRFRGDSDLKTWIYRIAVNQARNRWRWWKRRRRDFTVSLDANDTRDNRPLGLRLAAVDQLNPEQDALANEREAMMRRALRSLGTIYREAVIMRDVEGLSYEEIAGTLEISIGTVKSRIARGRIELRKRLERSL